MGAALSETERDGEALTWQQQRAQLVLVQQIQEARMLARNDNTNMAPAAAALNSLGLSVMPPVEQPSLLMSKVLTNPAHVRGKTIALRPGQHGEPMMLRFSFDTISPCLVTVYRSALLTLGSQGGWEVESAAWSSPSLPFEAGLGQSYEVAWESLFQSQAVSATFDSDARHCPLLVELRAEEVEKSMSPSVEWTICQLLTARSSSAGKTRIEVVSQQLCNSIGQPLELLEIFGSETTADGAARQDCIVCQSEPRDTVALPCRHMCLCSKCADYMRTRTQYTSYKCPICREKIGRMMRLDPASEPVTACSSDATCLEDAQSCSVAISV